MGYAPTPSETLFLWRLLASEGGEFLKVVKPDPKPAARRRLEQAGLIESTKRPLSSSVGPGRRVTFISLTEAGWDWACRNLDAEVSGRSTAAGPILQAIMQKLKAHLADCSTSLADFITGSLADGADEHCTTPEPAIAAQADDGVNATDEQGSATLDPAALIWEACRHLRGTSAAGAIHLARLRHMVPNISHDRFNHILLELERHERVVLYPLDNPRELDPEDEKASLPNSAGADRHILYMVEN